MVAVVFVIAAGLVLWLYLHRYWKWLKYLRWKGRAITFHEQQDRRRKGLCVNCGYDLRGSPDRCPECGRVRSDRRG